MERTKQNLLRVMGLAYMQQSDEREAQLRDTVHPHSQSTHAIYDPPSRWERHKCTRVTREGSCAPRDTQLPSLTAYIKS